MFVLSGRTVNVKMFSCSFLSVTNRTLLLIEDNFRNALENMEIKNF